MTIEKMKEFVKDNWKPLLGAGGGILSGLFIGKLIHKSIYMDGFMDGYCERQDEIESVLFSHPAFHPIRTEDNGQ